MGTTVVSAMDDLAEEPLGPNQSVMTAMDTTGDTKIIWDRSQPAEVENAKATFKRLKNEGYTAYSVKGKEGEKGEVLTEFDPSAERIIFARRMVGG